MKHIKKLLALCLTLALVLSLAACGKQEEQPPETTHGSVCAEPYLLFSRHIP